MESILNLAISNLEFEIARLFVYICKKINNVYSTFCKKQIKTIH